MVVVVVAVVEEEEGDVVVAVVAVVVLAAGFVVAVGCWKLPAAHLATSLGFARVCRI